MRGFTYLLGVSVNCKFGHIPSSTVPQDTVCCEWIGQVDETLIDMISEIEWGASSLEENTNHEYMTIFITNSENIIECNVY